MTVYPSVDEADVFAAYKQKPSQSPIEQPVQRLLEDQCFDLLDDLQRICHHGCTLDNAQIGAIQAKLLMLRINLNILHGVVTPQLGLSQPDPGLAEGLGQR